MFKVPKMRLAVFPQPLLSTHTLGLLLFACTLFSVALPSWAQREFDIEVVIFKRNINPETVNEAWPDELPDINYARAHFLDDAQYRQQKGVTLLNRSQYQLTDEVAKLKNHAGFDVLLHTAWRQDDSGRNSAPIFHLQAGRDYSSQFTPSGSAIIAEDWISSPIEEVSEHNIAQPLYELDGKLQIYVQHYLYAEAQLDLKKPHTKQIIIRDAPMMDEADEATVQIGHLAEIRPRTEQISFLKAYRLDQKRRMRSGETHYFDHPLLGMIIQVRRVNP